MQPVVSASGVVVKSNACSRPSAISIADIAPVDITYTRAAVLLR